METKTKNSETLTLNEVLASDRCHQLLEKQISTMYNKRADILHKAHAGARLRTSAFSTLEDKGLLTPQALCAEFELIVAKRSQLATREREYIKQVIVTAVMDTQKENPEIKLW